MTLAARNRELAGLGLAAAALAAGHLAAGLAAGQSIGVPVFRPLIWLAAVFLIVHLVLRLARAAGDQLFLPIAMLLCGLGLVGIAQLKPELVRQQAIWIALGAVALTAIAVGVDVRRLANYKYICGTLGVALLLAPVLVGKEVGGARLWLQVGPYSFQPSEIAKLLLVVFLAAYLSEKRELLAAGRWSLFGVPVPEIKHFGPLLVMWGISLALLILERDLGSSLLFFGLFLAMLHVATARGVYVVGGALLFLAGAYASYLAFSHVQARVDIWLQPLPADISGKAYQVAQSLFALAAGGLSGTGIGQGYLGGRIYMPAAHTDFVFSVLGEQTGLAGAMVIIICYLLFAFRGMRQALAADDDFRKLLAAGLTAAFGLQALVIIGGVLKLVPLTGITLPLVSYGGSAILGNMALTGLLLAVAGQRQGEPGEP